VKTDNLPRILAPEEKEGLFAFKNDTFKLGNTFLHMMTENGIIDTVPMLYGQEIEDLIIQMKDLIPTRRPTMREVIRRLSEI
jgi:hypothetical protein